MKQFRLLTVFATFLALFLSCNDDDDRYEVVLSEGDIPTEIITYTNDHFPENAIKKAIKDTERTVTYELFLEGGIELDFDENYEIYDIDGTTKLPDSVIPDPILAYVTENYPKQVITDWELENAHQQVELNNNLELEFDLDGTFIRIDND
ncbi:MAG: PepSY-like domain-containing protein [Mangrovibacterium sp.]